MTILTLGALTVRSTVPEVPPMANARTLAAFVAGALVALPGLAIAQAPFETPPVDTPPVEVPTPDDTGAGPDEAEDLEEQQLEAEEREQEEQAEELEEVEEQDDEDDPVVSALAACLPSGAELHGTGFNKGFLMRQAKTGEVSFGEGADSMALASTGDAEAICAAVQALADAAEAPETAKGRPDWAGPKDDRVPGAHGRDRAAKAKSDRGR